MDKSELIEKLKKMRLPVIAEQYELQSANPEYNQLSFDERFSELIDMEYDSRVNHTIERFIKNAHFYDSTASMESINYNPDRKLDRSQMEELSTNNYINNGLNVIFVGASGCGKTWLSNALGIHACRDRKTVLYIRLPELFSKFEEMRIQGKYNEYLKKLGKYDLMILDEFLLKSTSESELMLTPLWCGLLWCLVQKGRFIQDMSRLGDMRTQLLFGLKEWKMKGLSLSHWRY